MTLQAKMPGFERIEKLARRIANRGAATDISSHGVPVGGGWYDISSPASHDESEDILEAVEYLSLQGLLLSRRGGFEVKPHFRRRGGKR